MSDSERFRRRGNSAIELYVREFLRSARTAVEWPSARPSVTADDGVASRTEPERSSDRLGPRFTRTA